MSDACHAYPDDDRPRGSCPICTRRDPQIGRVCEPCRDWQPLALASIGEKYLDALALLVPDPEPDDRTHRDGKPHRDPVAVAARFTAGPTPDAPFDGRVSGSREPAAPLDLDLHDLLGAVIRDGGRDFDVTGDNWVPHIVGDMPRWRQIDGHWEHLGGRKQMVPAGDQIGHIPVAVLIDQEVRAWRDAGAPGSRFRPDPTMPAMVRWLGDRLPWAYERYEPIDTFASVVRLVRGRLMSALGEFDPPPAPCVGVQCKRCDKRMLFRSQDGSGEVECANPDCAKIYGQDEYADWARHLGGYERSLRTPEEVRDLLFGRAVPAPVGVSVSA